MPVGSSEGVRTAERYVLELRTRRASLRDQRSDFEDSENAQIAKGIRLKREIGEIQSAMRDADAAHQSAKDALEEMEQALENAVHMGAERATVGPEGQPDATAQAQQRLP